MTVLSLFFSLSLSHTLSLFAGPSINTLFSSSFSIYFHVSWLTLMQPLSNEVFRVSPSTALLLILECKYFSPFYSSSCCSALQSGSTAWSTPSAVFILHLHNQHPTTIALTLKPLNKVLLFYVPSLFLHHCVQSILIKPGKLVIYLSFCT